MYMYTNTDELIVSSSVFLQGFKLQFHHHGSTKDFSSEKQSDKIVSILCMFEESHKNTISGQEAVDLTLYWRPVKNRSTATDKVYTTA